MSQQNVEIMRCSNEAFNRGDVEAALSYLHPSIEWRDLQHPPDTPEVVRGAAAIREVWEGSPAWRLDDPRACRALEHAVAIETRDRAGRVKDERPAPARGTGRALTNTHMSQEPTLGAYRRVRRTLPLTRLEGVISCTPAPVAPRVAPSAGFTDSTPDPDSTKPTPMRGFR